MRFRLLALFLAFAGLLSLTAAFAPPSNNLQNTPYDFFSKTAGAWSDVVTVPKVNGQVSSVIISFAEHRCTWKVDVENLDSSASCCCPRTWLEPGNIRVDIDDGSTVWGSRDLSVFSAYVPGSPYFYGTIPAFDGTLDFAGTSAVEMVREVTIATDTDAIIITDSAFCDRFEGTSGSYDVPFEALVGWTGTDGGCASHLARLLATQKHRCSGVVTLVWR